jgi:hypothetical protein
VERSVPRRAGQRIRLCCPSAATRHLQFQQPQHLRRHCLATEGGLARSRAQWRTPTRLVLRRLDVQRRQDAMSGRLSHRFLSVLPPTAAADGRQWRWQIVGPGQILLSEPICRPVHRSQVVASGWVKRVVEHFEQKTIRIQRLVVEKISIICNELKQIKEFTN